MKHKHTLLETKMNNITTNNISFCGYDAIRLRGLYLQGMYNRGERNIFRELRAVLNKEGLDIFINNTNKGISNRYETNEKLIDKSLSIWGQDRKAFVRNKEGKQVLWDTNEKVMEQNDLGELSEFKINAASYLPRGGEYYIGRNADGERWLLINGFTIYDEKTFARFKDNPTDKIIHKIFDVKPENVIKLNIFGRDLDEIVRPIGFPYVLVNDYSKALDNVEKMYQKYPHSELYYTLKKHLMEQLAFSKQVVGDNTAAICKKLSAYGFKPIKIGGKYYDDINYLNAIAFLNKKDRISYISNSTRKSMPELEYLEKLFDEDLKKCSPKISDTYYISGGKRPVDERYCGSLTSLYSSGLDRRNIIMDILANRYGGIHCMSAEIPKF